MKLRFIPLGVLCALVWFGIHPPATAAAAEPAALAAPVRLLTLEEALRQTLQRGPDLKIATEELRVAEAESELAGRLPNPELTVSLENVAGDGAYQGTDAAELTIELSQPIELGGKLRLRKEAAELGKQLAANGEALAKADVLAVTRQRFVAVLVAQKRLVLVTEQADLTARALAVAEERIKAGKAPTIDRLRLQGEASQANLTVIQTERTLLTARQALAACWGDVQPDFERADGDLGILPVVPALDEVDTTLEQTAAAASRRLTTELSRIELEQARAGHIPDPSLTIGWRQFEESKGNALLFGISMPLPLFNQGQQAVAAASSRFNAAKAREDAARNQVRATLRSAWQALADARSEAEMLAGQVVPAAAEAFSAAEFGYQAGKFGLIDLLDARRNLFEVRRRQLDAQAAAQLAAIELQRLLGREPVTVVTSQPSSL